jgi:GNAT superfamily N-acetyltransferase
MDLSKETVLSRIGLSGKSFFDIGLVGGGTLVNPAFLGPDLDSGPSRCTFGDGGHRRGQLRLWTARAGRDHTMERLGAPTIHQPKKKLSVIPSDYILMLAHAVITAVTGLNRRLRRDGWTSTVRVCLDLLRNYQWDLFAFLQAPPQRADNSTQISRGVDLLRLHRANSGWLADEFYYDEKNPRADCFFALLKGQLAGIIWAVPGYTVRPFFVLDCSSVELTGLYVLPHFRNRGLATSLYAQAAYAMSRRGFHSVFAVIRNDNLPSQRAAHAAGFRCVAQLRRTLLFGPKFALPGASNPPKQSAEISGWAVH